MLSKTSVVRLMTCQALCIYNSNIPDEKDIEKILKNINTYFVKDNFIEVDGKTNNYNGLYKTEFIRNFIKNVIEKQPEIDVILNKFLKGYNTIENLLDTTRESFRLAIYEMLYCKDVHYKVILSEYVDIVAELTNDDKETRFFNAIAEKIAAELRSDEHVEQKEQKRNILKLKK